MAPRKPDDIRKRYRRLLGDLVGDQGVISVHDLVGRMDLQTTVRPAARRQYIEKYLTRKLLPEPAWAYQIGESIPRPWCSGLWGLWCAAHFEDFILTIQLAVEQTNDQYFGDRAKQVWHFIDALAYVGEPLRFDHFREVRAINQDRDMPISRDILRFRELFEVLRSAAYPEGRINRELFLIFRRQIAKRRLVEATRQLSGMVDLIWPLVEDPKYTRFYTGKRGACGNTITIPNDVMEELRLPSIHEPERNLDHFVNEHLESADYIARDRGGVTSRAIRIVDDLKRWARSLHYGLTEDPIEGESLDEAYWDLLEPSEGYRETLPW